MMYRIVVVIGVWLCTILNLVGQDIGPRFLILTCNDRGAGDRLEVATEYLKAAHIPYTLELDKEEVGILLPGEKAEPYMERNTILKEISLFTMIESSELDLHGYEAFTTSQEPIAIRVDAATENIKTVIQNMGDLEIPISPLPKQYVRLLRMPKYIEQEIIEENTGQNIEQEVIDISRFNRMIRWVMILAIIAFIYFIREGRKREKRKFYKKGNI